VIALAALMALAAPLAAASAASPQGAFARTAVRDVPPGLDPDEARLEDLDRDGVTDLLLSAHAVDSDYSRVLLAWTSIAADGPVRPLRLDLTPDVVAWTVADVHPDPGAELVLLTASSAFAWRPTAAEEQRFVRLFGCELLWQLPAPDRVMLLESAALDVDGDGLDDLLLPEPGGWRIARQRREPGAAASAFLQQVLRVPPEVSDWEGLGPETAGGAAVRGGSRGSTMRFAVELSGETEEAGAPATLLAMVESAPVPRLVDWDGDQRPDLVAQSVEKLHVWRQREDGSFPDAPDGSFDLPVVADRERRLDASYSAEALDLDGDRRADVAIFAGDKRSEDVRTQLMSFFSGAAQRGGAPRDPFGERGVPQDLLVLAGFVAAADFEDLDGDGYPELVARTVRPDLIDQLRSAASETIDAQLFVYRSDRGRLARRPGLSWRYTVPIKAFLPTVRFVGDVTGDRVAELVVRDQPGRVQLYMMRAQGEGWTLVERPLWESSCDPGMDLWVRRPPGRPAHDLVMVEPSRVVHVRFGR
jgi:hypothetical protein